jgi:hypothetical protein
MQCLSCRRDLAGDAPIHRVSLSWQQTCSVVRYVCGDCASRLSDRPARIEPGQADGTRTTRNGTPSRCSFSFAIAANASAVAVSPESSVGQHIAAQPSPQRFCCVVVVIRRVVQHLECRGCRRRQQPIMLVVPAHAALLSAAVSAFFTAMWLISMPAALI